MHTLRNLMAALAVAGVVVTGCSSSSSSGGSDDGGKGDGPSSDAHMVSDGKSGDAKPPPSDGGGDCAFADFVIGLINKDTTATATPSTDLGASLQDSQEQSCFSSLF
jgi:hypothetical protein